MEDERKELKSYYDMAYLDDNNITHLTKIESASAVDFMKNRFTVLQCNFVKV